MADPVVIVEKIIDIAIGIKEAVETVKENKEECHGIEKLVHRVSDLLSLLKESEMMRHRVVGGPLEDLGNAVSRARDVVTACQGKNIMCLCCKAAKLAKKLSQVKNDISNGMMLAIFATNVTIFVATKGQQSPPDLFLVGTYRSAPMSEHLPSSPRVVVQDLLPTSSLPTDEFAASPSSPRQVPPSYAPVIAHVPTLEQSSQVHKSPPPPPTSDPQYTNVAPMIKNPSHRPPKKPTPPPLRIPYKSPTPPPSSPLPTNTVSAMPTHTSHHSPTRPKPSPHPSANLYPRSPLKNTVEISGHISDPVSSTSSEHSSGKSDEINNKSAEREEPSRPLPGLKRFNLSELEDATNNFSEANKVGSSDFGTVYKGVLRNKLVVAIKEFQDPPQFLVGRLCAELLLASELQSRKTDAFSSTTRKNNTLSGESKNVITIMGYGHELLKKDRRLELHIFIVEEYMQNGNMASIICGPQLDWPCRFRIIQGIAQGLHYLHEQNIVHMNVKPANILLDSDMDPKITDFGIAKKLDKPVTHDNNIAGTVGYMPPEYILEGILSMKYDVYSFGVIILETISGMSKGDEPAQHHVSISWAWNVRECQQMSELFDPSLFEESNVAEIKRCLEIGMLCTQFEHAERPTMVSVLEMLNGKEVLPIPKQPEYTKGRNLADKGASHKDRSRR